MSGVTERDKNPFSSAQGGSLPCSTGWSEAPRTQQWVPPQRPPMVLEKIAFSSSDGHPMSTQGRDKPAQPQPSPFRPVDPNAAPQGGNLRVSY